MPYDYSKLIGRIAEKGETRKSTAKYGAKITSQAFSSKLRNKTRFEQDQIRGICSFLNIPCEEIHEYFFCWRG